MPKKPEILIGKRKFDALLTRMLNIPPLPKKDVRVKKRKPKKRKK